MSPKENRPPIILQQNILFSQCQLWQLQKEFFSQQGIQAWAEQVPFYITSNPYIAYSYAQVIIRFMQDCSRQSSYQPSTPFYIVELGAGSGRFSFYLLKHLAELQQTLQITRLNFVYIMTDFNEQIIDYWEQHPALQTFIKQGVLDFALYDTDQNQTIHLRKSNKTIAKSTVPANPMIVLANYVFDSILHDVFSVKDSQLYEGLATLVLPAEEFIDGKPKRLAATQVHMNYRPNQHEPYVEPEFNQVLNQCVQQFEQSYFTFPIGSLRCIKHLRELTGDNLLLLATDKGYANALATDLQHEHYAVFHGSFSMMVNFDAIASYTKNCGGDNYFQTAKQSILTTAFVFGNTFNNLPETQQALKSYVDYYSPGNLFSLYKFINENKQTADLSTILTWLKISGWDPYLFNACLQIILALIPKLDEATHYELQAWLPHIANNYYQLPADNNTLFNIGLTYQNLGNVSEAIRYYQLSLIYPETYELSYYNMGLCYYALQQFDSAINCFRQVLEKKPDHISAFGWLAYTINQINIANNKAA